MGELAIFWCEWQVGTDGLGCSLHPDTEAPTIFGKKVQRHDGAIDIVEGMFCVVSGCFVLKSHPGADLVTMSHCLVYNHDKSHLVGNKYVFGLLHLPLLLISSCAATLVTSGPAISDVCAFRSMLMLG